MMALTRPIAAFLVCLAAVVLPAHAGTVRVAVAANFSAPMKAIAADFERATGHHAGLSFGSTGKFYAQIRNGAPFDVFLAADDETPARLERDGGAVPGSRFTYAVGALVLWSARPDLVDARGEVLGRGGFERLAIANPRLAPYGAAAWEVMERLGVLDRVRSRLVQGENIAQTWQFVQSGNAELGFVAASQVIQDGRLVTGSAWRVPAQLHAPIRQDAVLLHAGRGNVAAEALLAYLRSEPALARIRAHGYTL